MSATTATKPSAQAFFQNIGADMKGFFVKMGHDIEEIHKTNVGEAAYGRIEDAVATAKQAYAKVKADNTTASDDTSRTGAAKLWNRTVVWFKGAWASMKAGLSVVKAVFAEKINVKNTSIEKKNAVTKLAIRIAIITLVALTVILSIAALATLSATGAGFIFAAGGAVLTGILASDLTKSLQTIQNMKPNVSDPSASSSTADDDDNVTISTKKIRFEESLDETVLLKRAVCIGLKFAGWFISKAKPQSQ